MTIDKTDEGVLVFPIKRVSPPDGMLMLVPPPYEKCCHFGASFEVDIDAGDCKCLRCGERVAAIFVLQQLMHDESRWMKARQAYQAEMKRLKDRRRTKCEHCHQMTRISDR